MTFKQTTSLLLLSSVLVVFLSGCATSQPKQSLLEGIDTASKDSSCIRECSKYYSDCVSVDAGDGVAAITAVRSVIQACGASLNICASSCPDK